MAKTTVDINSRMNIARRDLTGADYDLDEN